MKTQSNDQIKEHEQLEQLKDDFLSSISHELRSPLANIKMATQMLKVLFQQDEARGVIIYDRLDREPHADHVDSELQAEPLPQLQPNRFEPNRFESNRFEEVSQVSSLKTRAVRYIQILERECDREISLLNNVLDLQQLDAGTYGFSSAVIRLQDWLPTVIKPFLPRLVNQQQQLHVDGVKQLPEITTDPLSFERLLSELLTNACKFTPPGGKISIAAQLVPSPAVEGRQMLQLDVTNSKVEIPASELSRIFERFYRLSTHDRWKHGGTGLGLALVKALTEHLGGTVTATSGAGETRFTVTIPIDRERSA